MSVVLAVYKCNNLLSSKRGRTASYLTNVDKIANSQQVKHPKISARQAFSCVLKTSEQRL